MSIQDAGSSAGADQPGPGGVPRLGPDVPPPAVPQQADPGNTAAGQAVPERHHVLRRTRAGGLWVTIAVAAVVLILLLIFILENLKSADVSFFGAHAHLPLGVALLLSAAAGALIVIIPGTGRIVQLRRTARRHRQQEAQLPR